MGFVLPSKDVDQWNIACTRSILGD